MTVRPVPSTRRLYVVVTVSILAVLTFGQLADSVFSYATGVIVTLGVLWFAERMGVVEG